CLWLTATATFTARDFNPIEHAHAGRTTKQQPSFRRLLPLSLAFYQGWQVVLVSVTLAHRIIVSYDDEQNKQHHQQNKTVVSESSISVTHIAAPPVNFLP